MAGRRAGTYGESGAAALRIRRRHVTSWKGKLRYSGMSIVFPESLKGLTLWRYMDLEKLLALLQDRALFFPQLKSFRDPYEGIAPIEWRGAVTDLNQIPDLLTNSGDWQKIPLSFDDGEFVRDENLPAELYVSCWHINPGESAAMWTLYSNDKGLAVKTTSDQLAEALHFGQARVELAAVEYIEIVPGLMSGSPWRIKRPSFQHERELRAVIRDGDCKMAGLRVPVDLETLIEEIYISPDSEPWIADVVKKVLLTYGLHKNVQRSDLWRLT
jgi:hypothetical protein